MRDSTNTSRRFLLLFHRSTNGIPYSENEKWFWRRGIWASAFLSVLGTIAAFIWLILLITLPRHHAPGTPPSGINSLIKQWRKPRDSVTLLSPWSSDFTKDITPISCHSHNDYRQLVPLFEALAAGCTGVEADIWIHDKAGSKNLLVGHSSRSHNDDRTLQSLYIEPLVTILENRNNISAASRGSNNSNGVFQSSSNTTLTLLLDFKSDGAKLWPLANQELEVLRSKGWLTSWSNSTGDINWRPIIIVATGNAPYDLLVSNTTYRDVFYDAPLDDISNPKYDSSNSYYASVSMGTLGKIWFWKFSSVQLNKIKTQTALANEKGLKSRYWNTPAWPVSFKEYISGILVENGVGMLNVDEFSSTLFYLLVTRFVPVLSEESRGYLACLEQCKLDRMERGFFNNDGDPHYTTEDIFHENKNGTHKQPKDEDILESKRNSSSLIVDLGYSVYQGYYNATSRLNIFKGIRYAAPPLGALRWQKPQSPAEARASTIQATAYPPHCPQSNDAPMPANYNFTRSGLGNEDCLFLSVWASPNATNLPVMIWIHGGGYGTGSGNNDFSELAITNSNAFIIVAIQYRLGAFGFLSSADLVTSGGVPNAGLYDMNFSFQWVQSHISKFGGDPSRVTIAGESAGGGAVMLQIMAYGGTLGTTLFSNGIVASPYLPMQYDYDGLKPEGSYGGITEAVGCGKSNGSAFDCLVATDTLTLQNASAYISANGNYGQWAFLPVTDGEFLVKRPSEQLLAGEVNGNNANEAPGFVPQHINTTTAFNTFTQSLFPLMSNSTLNHLHQVYSIPPTTPGTLFATAGNSGPTALDQSVFAIGQQQRANNLYAETTFVCPSYWIASAFSQSWKYEYSVPPAQHGCDLDAYYAVNRTYLGYGTLSPGFRTAVQKIWGRFIVYDDPTLPADVIVSITNRGNGTHTGDDISAAGTGIWPQWSTDRYSHEKYKMLKLNMTGGEETKVLWTSADGGVSFDVSENTGLRVRADLEIVDAWGWEGGRGARCEFWVEIGREVPE
ncbi:hypothetical protein SBOR_8394 [Sclerotinia borealis F-4128]|uniref:Carboxylesterase type B domain-containing protein n=1 Tax=Sclerotinia borealis (strain F-4128) TaxID=1432307 RepID=W9C9H3_SCLBF|nr:hypothetical protein SBOR_8394 [Sclerotinia borealis F-4128]